MTLMMPWQEFDLAEVSVGVPQSSSSDQTSLKRGEAADLIERERGFFWSKVSIGQVDTASAL